MKYDSIAATIKNDIVEGAFGETRQLPPRPSLMRRFSATNATIQNAMDLLAAEGFVVSRGRNGTFVSQNSPHLSRYGVAIPGNVNTTGESLWRSVWTALKRVERASSFRGSFAVYENLEKAQGTAGFDQLVDDIDGHRLAGLVFFHVGWDLIPRLAQPWLPIVHVSQVQEPHTAVRIEVDYGTLLEEALTTLREKGRTRVALVSTASLEPLTDTFHSFAASSDCSSPWRPKFRAVHRRSHQLLFLCRADGKSRRHFRAHGQTVRTRTICPVSRIPKVRDPGCGACRETADLAQGVSPVSGVWHKSAFPKQAIAGCRVEAASRRLSWRREDLFQPVNGYKMS